MSNTTKHLTDNVENLSIRVPISSMAREQAQAFAATQPTPEKRLQVYHNTLAVWVVHDYLQWQQYETALEAGDSWHAGTQLCGDVADLVVTGVGRIECRPVVESDPERFCIPPETWHNRIAYVGVRLDQDGRDGQILGFTPALDPDEPPDEVRVADLQSVDEWMDYFDRLEMGQQVLANVLADLKDTPEYDADALASVETLWEGSSQQELLVAQLERIVHGERPSRWRFAGEKVLSGRGLTGAVRETDVSVDRLQVQEIAGAMLAALADAWNDRP